MNESRNRIRLMDAGVGGAGIQLCKGLQSRMKSQLLALRPEVVGTASQAPISPGRW